jgi:hypothetical protein
MKITLAAIADYASISIEQKLHVLGVFDVIWASSFPCTHPTMFLVMRTAVEYGDRSSKTELQIRLEHEDGQRLFEGKAEGEVGDIPPGESVSANMIFQLNMMKFDRPGRYSVVITDIQKNEELHRLPLTLRQLQSSQP